MGIGEKKFTQQSNSGYCHKPRNEGTTPSKPAGAPRELTNRAELALGIAKMHARS